MQTIGGVLRNVDHEIHLRWQQIRSRAANLFTRERTTELVMLSFTLTLCSFLVYCLHKAVHSFTMMNPPG